MSGPGQSIDKREARRAFERAATGYDEAAVLQREIGERLLERLDYVRLEPRRILDLGAGTGRAAGALARRYPKARVIAVDFALSMLRIARRQGPWRRRPRCICADVEHLPVADASFDLIFSNATMQWCTDLEHSFRELLRVTRSGGLLTFTTFGPDTLTELRQAWARADGREHVSSFADMHDVGDALVHVGWAEPVMDVDRFVLTYETVHTLMRDLKVLGAHNVSAGRHRGLTGKARMQAMIQAYEALRTDGRLPATWEVVYGHAWAPEQRTEAGVTTVPLSSLRR
ncbi:MAG: malonyl-ACP O-methyltransferase BioC [Chromatiales bacterium]|jgi:malonyl-CoA O-methyltransferase